LYEVWSLDGAPQSRLPSILPLAKGQIPRVQNVDLDAYARASGLVLLPIVLTQTETERDGLIREWPQAARNFQQNLGYALQWFAFAAIAAIAWLVVIAQALRRVRRRAP
jgi:cytochrome oxidase assembly protein ShyY1